MPARRRRTVSTDRRVPSTQLAAPPRVLIEVVVLAGVYAGYGVVRNRFGSAQVEPATALANARDVIAVQDRLGLWFEPQLQAAVLDWTTFIQFWNLWYGLMHFAVTAGVFGALLWLARRGGVAAQRYRHWRTVIVAMTLVSLIGYAVYPLMPPRLLGDCGRFGGCAAETPRFVDTAVEVGGIWSFESSAIEAVSNQYAAMPSLHVGWAVWVAVVAAALTPRTWRIAGFGHLGFTVFGVLVTANHYWLDAVGGVVVFAVGLAVAAVWPGIWAKWPGRHHKTSVGEGSDAGSANYRQH